MIFNISPIFTKNIFSGIQMACSFYFLMLRVFVIGFNQLKIGGSSNNFHH